MILQVQEVAFRYNSHPVLQNVSFSVSRGELAAILGPNGVGKTTLLKCVNAIHRPFHGAVLVEGIDVLRLAPDEIARGMGYVPQRSESARVTVFDAVLMGRKPHIRWKSSKKDLAIVDAALKRLELKPMMLRYIDQLSGGELQKVSLARALVQEPQLLLLDEPTSSLDLRNQIEIMVMLRHIIEQHDMAAVMTMHDLNTALRFAHKFIFVKDGKVLAAVDKDGVDAAIIEDVYGLPVELHTVNNQPLVVPVPTCDY